MSTCASCSKVTPSLSPRAITSVHGGLSCIPTAILGMLQHLFLGDLEVGC